MEDKNMQTQIDELNRKMDLVLEELEHQKRRRREMEELQEDLMIVGKDLYKTAVEEMEEVHDYINTGDMLYLFKKLMRNVRTLTNAFEQFESVKDFIEDFTPLSKDIVFDLMAKLDEYDRKGYFQFAQELTKGLDNIVDSFTVDDVKNLSDNLVTILNTVKNLTQPDMLQAVNNALEVYKNLDVQVDKKVTTFGLIREMNKPETKKGMAFAIRFLKNLSESNFAKNTKQITN